jgi:hypothetical protein
MSRRAGTVCSAGPAGPANGPDSMIFSTRSCVPTMPIVSSAAGGDGAFIVGRALRPPAGGRFCPLR